MSTYSSQDFERIAETIGKRPALVTRHGSRFEAAATWYRLCCRAPKGIHLADTAKRMQQISNTARRLLRQLDVYDHRNAPDGPGDTTLLEFLASAEAGAEDEIINATARTADLPNFSADASACHEQTLSEQSV